MGRQVVRNWAAKKCHVADVPDSLLYPVKILGSEGQAVATPIAALCRVELKRDPVIVMTKARVDCVTCSRISGIERIDLGEAFLAQYADCSLHPGELASECERCEMYQ